MLQLNPMLPLWHAPTQQAVTAFLVLDYSQEHDLLFVCMRADGEIWTIPNKELRAQHNASLGRPDPGLSMTLQEWAERAPLPASVDDSPAVRRQLEKVLKK